MNTTSNNTPFDSYHLFGKKNILILIVACILIVTGFLLMSGSGSTKNNFNPAIFSTRRIVVAPIICLAGYLLVIIGILWKKAR